MFVIKQICRFISFSLMHPNNYALKEENGIEPHLLLDNIAFLKSLETRLQSPVKKSGVFFTKDR